MECTCGEKRTYTMIIWGKHFEGCPVIRKWPSLGVPVMMLVAAMMLGCATTPATPAEPKCKRYCTSSKACGDGCIPYENQCHKPPGSACTVSVHD